MTVPAHIVALAARTPVGRSAESSAAAVRAGISRVGEHPFMVDAAGEPLICGLDSGLPAELFGPERIQRLMCSVFDELLDKLTSALPLAREVPCWLALPEPRPGFTEHPLSPTWRATPAWLSPHLPPGLKVDVQPIMQGHAGAVLGIELAMHALASDQAELCMVAGVDSYFDADTLDWLEEDRRLMRAGSRGGFPPGEGAALVALASDAARRRLRLPSLGVIRSVAHAVEQGREASDEGLLGIALTDVYTRLAAQAEGGLFDHVFIDINDERARTTDYAFATLRCGRSFRDASVYTTSVGSTGELGAASLPFHCVLAAQSFARAYATGAQALVSSASWNGLRGALVMQSGRA